MPLRFNQCSFNAFEGKNWSIYIVVLDLITLVPSFIRLDGTSGLQFTTVRDIGYTERHQEMPRHCLQRHTIISLTPLSDTYAHAKRNCFSTPGNAISGITV